MNCTEGLTRLLNLEVATAVSNKLVPVGCTRARPSQYTVMPNGSTTFMIQCGVSGLACRVHAENNGKWDLNELTTIHDCPDELEDSVIKEVPVKLGIA